MERELEGKVALVTGASRGIGAAIAKRLASDGAKVALTYSTSPGKAAEVVAGIEAGGGTAIAVHADSENGDAVKRAVAETVKAFGRVDILVNNAGISVMGAVDAVTPAELDRMLAVNVKSVFISIQEALRHMGRGGRIINIGSSMSAYTAFPNASVYTLTKGAIAGLTRGLARDLGPRGITVNNVMPGPTDTDMNPADGPVADIVRSGIAMQRYGEGKDIASLVTYLASPQASFITGANILVDGGFTA